MAFSEQRGDNRGKGARQKKPWVEVDEFGQPAPLTEEQSARLRERATNLCVWHLGRAAKSRKQLVDVLVRKQVPAPMIEEVLNKLADLNYINDSQFAEDYVRSRYEYQRKARGAIRYELSSKGIDQEDIAAALEQIDDDSEARAARELVDRKLRSTQGMDPRKRTNRLVGMLARKGYPPGLAFSVVREAIADEEQN